MEMDRMVLAHKFQYAREDPSKYVKDMRELQEGQHDASSKMGE